MADKKHIINHKQLRKITNSFSWIDHRTITGGFLDNLNMVDFTLLFSGGSL